MIDEDQVYERLAGATQKLDLAQQNMVISRFFCRCLGVLEPTLDEFMQLRLQVAIRYWFHSDGEAAELERARIECWTRFAQFANTGSAISEEYKLRLLMGVLQPAATSRSELLEGIEWSLEWLNHLQIDAARIENCLAGV